MRVREKIFSELLTAGGKLIKLKLSFQDFLLLGPVRLLPLGDRAFSFRPCFIPSCSIVEYSALLSVFIFRALGLVFRHRVIKCIACKNNG